MKAVFPGSFDPFTIGHADIVRRALPLFDGIIIAVGENIGKAPVFPLDERLASIRRCFADEPKISVVSYSCLTTELARGHNAAFIIRGVRSVADFEYERAMADANKSLSIADGEQPIETLLLYTSPSLSHISSSLLRDLHKHGKDITPYLP